MKTLTHPQQSAVDSRAARILCIAGAGSGKTETARQRVAALVAQGVDAKKIVVLTFTNAAAHEFKARLKKCCERDHNGDGNCDRHPNGIRLGFVGTLHAFCVRMLREHGSKVGVWDGFTVIDEDQREELLQSLAVAHKCRDSWKQLEKTVADYLQTIAHGGEVRGVTAGLSTVRAYVQALGDSNALDFDLLLVRTLQLFRKPGVWGSMFGFTHLFVDEFQDSGDLDAALYEAMPFTHRFFVGDPDQAVYSFRGGNVAHILNSVENNIGGGNVVVLEENFRCGRRICDAAQRLVEQNTARFKKRTVSALPFDGEIDVWTHSEPDSELRFIARHIIDSKCQDDCAVLFATNDLCRRACEVFEKDFGIAIKAKGLGDVPPDFSKARALMAFAVNPNSDLLAKQVCAWKFGKEQVGVLAQRAALGMTTINALVLNVSPMRAVPELLAYLLAENISADSLRKLHEIAAKLDADATAIDLIVAASKDMHHRDEIGTGAVVTTFHSAKGREFGTVFLGACEQAVIPSARVAVNIEEQRRLFYVGMTRAKRNLIVSYSRARAPFGSRRLIPTEPSQFIAEAGLRGGE